MNWKILILMKKMKKCQRTCNRYIGLQQCGNTCWFDTVITALFLTSNKYFDLPRNLDLTNHMSCDKRKELFKELNIINLYNIKYTSWQFIILLLKTRLKLHYRFKEIPFIVDGINNEINPNSKIMIRFIGSVIATEEVIDELYPNYKLNLKLRKKIIIPTTYKSLSIKSIIKKKNNHVKAYIYCGCTWYLYNNERSLLGLKMEHVDINSSSNYLKSKTLDFIHNRLIDNQYIICIYS